MAGAGMFWAGLSFYWSVRPPEWLTALLIGYGLEFSTPFVPGVLYSWYACMHSFYIALSVGLSHMLISRGWMRTAAFAAALPGPGFALSLLQMIPAVRIWLSLNETEWRKFFEWRHRANPVNDLTKKRGGKLLPF